MRFRNFYINLIAAIFALAIGAAMVAVYQHFLGVVPHQNECTRSKSVEFDLDDPNSELPIDHDEHLLSSPHEDEANEDMFDPEGTYSLIGTLSSDFERFSSFTINNKRLDVARDDKRFGQLIKPTGYTTGVKATRQIGNEQSVFSDLAAITIANNEIRFTTLESNGVVFEFSGAFLVKGNFYTLDPDATVVTGTLTKIENGKNTAETRVSFTWELEINCNCG